MSSKFRKGQCTDWGGGGLTMVKLKCYKLIGGVIKEKQNNSNIASLKPESVLATCVEPFSLTLELYYVVVWSFIRTFYDIFYEILVF